MNRAAADRRGTRAIAMAFAAVLLVAACSSGPGSGGQLEGTDWVLRAYDQDGVLTLVPETLYADAEFFASRVRGFSGCNQYDARYRAGGRTLLVSSRTAVTLMACPEEATAFEAAYLGLLDDSRYYSARRQTLTVYNAARTTILVFDAAPRNPLRGTWRVDSFATAPNTVSAVLEGTELDAVFGIASVGGSAGCNSYSGTYGTNGNVVRIGRLATTRKACPPDVMAQEGAFLEALQGAALIETRADGLNLTDLSGSIVVSLVRPTAEQPTASESPGPSPTSSVEPTATETAKPTSAPTAKPTATPPPTAAPTSSPGASAAPTLSPPPVIPTVETCDLLTTDGTTVGFIAYPGSWFTVAEPPELACRYFDPDQISVPSDPATLVTAVQVSTDPAAWTDVVSAATDPASWDVHQQVDLVLDGLPAKLVEATATAGTSVPAGTSRLAYFIDFGAAGTVTMWTTGAADDPAYQSQAGIVTLMAALSVFQAPS